MRSWLFGLAVILACLMGGTSAAAQEGFPLKGSWIGTWTPNKNQGNDVLVVMAWDGKTITGTINPGTDNIAIKKATLNPEGWLVHIEADAKDKAGNPITYTIDGKIENLSLPNRMVVGTWKNQQENGAFRITRQ